MKPRPILELLQILREGLDGPFFKSGLCALTYTLNVYYDIITEDEEAILNAYLEKYKPNNASGYWWPKGKRKPRQRFLKKLIKKEQRWNRLLQVLRFWES